MTSDGLFLIDMVNDTEEARDILVPEMRKAGLDPAGIKYIVITHGHPGQSDHTAGAITSSAPTTRASSWAKVGCHPPGPAP